MTIHHVFANKSNIGDWLSARAIQTLLSPLPIVEHLCDEPFVPETLGHLATAGPEDFIIIGGGGLFMDYFAPFWEGFQEIAERVPFCIWGVGYCDMKRENSHPPQELLQSIIKRSQLCVVRDELTRTYLSQRPSPRVVPCPSMTLVSARPLGHGLLHVDAYDNVGEDLYEIMDSLSQAYAAQTSRPFRAINNRIPGGNEGALWDTLNLYHDADLIITGRLHACIIGVAMGRKVLAVSGDRKIESFMNLAGLNKWVLGLDQIAILPDRLRDLPNQETPWDFVKSARLENESIAAQIRTLLLGKQNAPKATPVTTSPDGGIV